MKQSKLIQMMVTLTSAELNEFGRYVNTDFFNKRMVLRALYKSLKNLLKNKDKNLTKLAVFKKIYPKDPLSRQHLFSLKEEKRIKKKVDWMMYEMKKLLEDFIVWKQAQEQPSMREKLLMDYFNTRKSDVFYFDLHNQRIASLEAVPTKTIEQHRALHELTMTAFNHPQTVIDLLQGVNFVFCAIKRAKLY